MGEEKGKWIIYSLNCVFANTTIHLYLPDLLLKVVVQ